jgi:hypothetical protein
MSMKKNDWHKSSWEGKVSNILSSDHLSDTTLTACNDTLDIQRVRKYFMNKKNDICENSNLAIILVCFPQM